MVWQLDLIGPLYYKSMNLASPRVDCSDHDKCLARLITPLEIAIVSAPIAPDYSTLSILTANTEAQLVCTLIDNMIDN